MRVLQVSAYPPGRYGGSERFATELSKKLVERGHKVTLLTSDMDSQTVYEETDGLEILRYRCINNLWNINPLTVILHKLLRESSKYDIIHAHGHIFFTSNQVAFAKKIKDYKYILHLHGGITPESNDAPAKRLLVKKWFYDTTLGRFTVNSADAIASVSKIDINNAIRIFRSRKEKFVWIPPAVDTKKFCNSNFHRNNGTKNITYIGRLEPWKGADLFIEAAKKIVAKNNSDIKFTVVGDGTLKYYLLKASVGYPIKFLGSVNHENIPKILADSTLLLLPSRLEGLPTVCVEASACGVPIVASNVGGTSEVVKHGYNGYIYYQPDLDKAIEYITVLLDSPSLREKMGSNGVKLVEKRFSWGKVTERVEKLYYKLINS